MQLAGIIIAAMLLFPPYHCIGANGIVLKSGYAFIFSIPEYTSSLTQYGQTIITVIPGTIDHITLLIQVAIAVAAVALMRKN